MHLVVFCDGTWNTPDQMDGDLPAPTNVVKLRNALAPVDAQGAKQNAYYHPGVGTDGGWWNRIAGGGMGEGLNQNIKSAYQWLAYNYEPGASIWLFGFSRGAYTARSLGGMLSLCGLFDIKASGLDTKGVWDTIDEIFESYRRGKREKALPATLKRPFHHIGTDGDPRHSMPIHFIGVWDTVGALGVPDDMALLNLIDDPTRHEFHDTRLSDVVRNARHAVAIDEKRQSFAPTLWDNVADNPNVKQLWFPGSHGDVGGGYGRCGLSDGALAWMMNEAADLGLAFRDSAAGQLAPDPRGQLHDSVAGIFKALKTRPRAVPPIETTSVTSGMLHASAWSRHDDPPIVQGPYWPTRRATPASPVLVDIYARDRWNFTGIYLEARQTYTFTASGEWKDSDIPAGPAGTADGKFHLGEAVHVISSFFEKGETIYTKMTGNHNIDFWYTKRQKDFQWFSLVGMVANDVMAVAGPIEDPRVRADYPPHEIFLIGRAATFTPSASGYLYAFANDAWQAYENNRGHVALTVR